MRGLSLLLFVSILRCGYGQIFVSCPTAGVPPDSPNTATSPTIATTYKSVDAADSPTAVYFYDGTNQAACNSELATTAANGDSTTNYTGAHPIVCASRTRNEYTYYALVTYGPPNVIRANDKVYKITCAYTFGLDDTTFVTVIDQNGDSTDPLDVFTTPGPGEVTGPGGANPDLRFTTFSLVPETLIATVHDSVTDDDVSEQTVFITKRVYIKSMVVQTPYANPDFQSFKVMEIFAYDPSDANKNLTIYSNECPVDPAMTDLALSGGFLGIVQTNDTGNNEYEMARDSQDFDIFRWTVFDSLVQFRVTVLLCIDIDDPFCTPQSTCGARRRREAGDENDGERSELTTTTKPVRVIMDEDLQLAWDMAHKKTEEVQGNMEVHETPTMECDVDPMVFYILLGILSAILLLCLIIIIALVSRQRKRKKGEEEENTYVYTNSYPGSHSSRSSIASPSIVSSYRK